jgi:hypothetical protein
MFAAIALAAMVGACGAKPPFWSLRSHKFETVQERPFRAELVGRWRSPRDTLVFLRSGKFTAGSQSGCWDVVDGDTARRVHILFVMGCLDYGAGVGEVIFIMAQPTAQCTFALTQNLTLRDCDFAGEYRRE